MCNLLALLDPVLQLRPGAGDRRACEAAAMAGHGAAENDWTLIRCSLPELTFEGLFADCPPKPNAPYI